MKIERKKANIVGDVHIDANIVKGLRKDLRKVLKTHTRDNPLILGLENGDAITRLQKGRQKLCKEVEDAVKKSSYGMCLPFCPRWLIKKRTSFCSKEFSDLLSGNEKASFYQNYLAQDGVITRKESQGSKPGSDDPYSIDMDRSIKEVIDNIGKNAEFKLMMYNRHKQDAKFFELLAQHKEQVHVFPLEKPNEQKEIFNISRYIESILNNEEKINDINEYIPGFKEMSRNDQINRLSFAIRDLKIWDTVEKMVSSSNRDDCDVVVFTGAGHAKNIKLRVLNNKQENNYAFPAYSFDVSRRVYIQPSKQAKEIERINKIDEYASGFIVEGSFNQDLIALALPRYQGEDLFDDSQSESESQVSSDVKRWITDSEPSETNTHTSSDVQGWITTSSE